MSARISETLQQKALNLLWKFPVYQASMSRARRNSKKTGRIVGESMITHGRLAYRVKTMAQSDAAPRARERKMPGLVS